MALLCAALTVPPGVTTSRTGREPKGNSPAAFCSRKRSGGTWMSSIPSDLRASPRKDRARLPPLRAQKSLDSLLTERSHRPSLRGHDIRRSVEGAYEGDPWEAAA